MNKAVILLSGGLDSAVCAVYAHRKYDEVHAIHFQYGQKHSKEHKSAHDIATIFNFQMTVVQVPLGLCKSAITSPDIEVDAKDDTGQDMAFLPGRNMVFLSLAAAYAWSIDADNLVIGVSEIAERPFADCTYAAMRSIENALRIANPAQESPIDLIGSDAYNIENNAVRATAVSPRRPISIDAPLQFLSKQETIEFGARYPSGLKAMALSWSCYKGGDEPCGECRACLGRISGFLNSRHEDLAL